MTTVIFPINDFKDNRKVAHLLSALDTKTYVVLKSLTVPAVPSDCSLAQIKEKLVSH